MPRFSIHLSLGGFGGPSELLIDFSESALGGPALKLPTEEP